MLYRRRQSKSVRKKRDGGFPYPRPVIYHTMPRTNLSLSPCPSQSTHEMRDSFDRASLTWPHAQDLQFNSDVRIVVSVLLPIFFQDRIVLETRVGRTPRYCQNRSTRRMCSNAQMGFLYNHLGSSTRSKCIVKQI